MARGGRDRRCNTIRLGQLDGDGRLDLAGVGWGTNTVGVLLNDGHGGLSPRVSYPVQHSGYDDLEIGDVTGDGRDDLVVMSGQTYAVPNVSVLAQLAAGGFGAASEYTVAANTNTDGIGVGDVNGDGRNDVDVVLADYNNGLVVLRNATAPTAAPAAPNLTAATASNRSVSLSWSPPSSNGGSPSGYYQVSAVNSLGEGARSNERSATTWTVSGAPQAARRSSQASAT